jgi:hypothetical protein
MTGIIETLLIERYGQPTACFSEQGSELRWNSNDARRQCRLFKSLAWTIELRSKLGVLEPIYGDASGGILIGDSLKIAMLTAPDIFGLYSIADLQCRPEIERAKELHSELCFFMDSSNVWYYGVADGDLYVYDAEIEELDNLGRLKSALQRVLDEYETTKQNS